MVNLSCPVFNVIRKTRTRVTSYVKRCHTHNPIPIGTPRRAILNIPRTEASIHRAAFTGARNKTKLITKLTHTEISTYRRPGDVYVMCTGYAFPERVTLLKM
jgi:hypothetical protein